MWLRFTNNTSFHPTTKGRALLLFLDSHFLTQSPSITRLHQCLILPKDSSTPFLEPLGVSHPLSPSTRFCTMRPEASPLPSPSLLAVTPSSLMAILVTSLRRGPSLDASAIPTLRSLLTMALPSLADSTCPSILPALSLVALAGPRTRCVRSLDFEHIDSP